MSVAVIRIRMLVGVAPTIIRSVTPIRIGGSITRANIDPKTTRLHSGHSRTSPSSFRYTTLFRAYVAPVALGFPTKRAALFPARPLFSMRSISTLTNVCSGYTDTVAGSSSPHHNTERNPHYNRREHNPHHNSRGHNRSRNIPDHNSKALKR